MLWLLPAAAPSDYFENCDRVHCTTGSRGDRGRPDAGRGTLVAAIEIPVKGAGG